MFIILGVFRVTFFRVESSDFETFSDLPQNFGGKSLKVREPVNPTFEKNRQKSGIVFKYSNI